MPFMCLRVWMGNVKVVHPNDHWLVMNKEWIFIQIKNYIYEGPQTTLSSSPHFPHWRFVTIMLVGFASVPYKWSHTSKSVICTSSHFRTAWKGNIFTNVYNHDQTHWINKYTEFRHKEGLLLWSPQHVLNFVQKTVCTPLQCDNLLPYSDETSAYSNFVRAMFLFYTQTT